MINRLFLLVAMLVSSAAQARVPLLRISPSNFDRSRSIITFRMDPKLISNGYNCVIDQRTRHKAFLQLLSDNTFVFILPDSIKAGKTAYFELASSKLPSKKTAVSVGFSENSGELSIFVNQRKLFVYQTKLTKLPDGVEEVYNRSGFIHPLYSPMGKVLTDDFPVGHAHQHGIMMAWTNTTFKAKPVDFWNQHQKTGNVKHLKIGSIEKGPVFTKVNLKLEHYGIQSGTVLNEDWAITVYSFSSFFLFDISSTQKNVSSDTLFINKNNYGGMGLRGNRQWNNADSLHYKQKWTVETNNGDDLRKADGKTASYVSVSGDVDGAACGLTVFGFPSNFRYPQPVRVHPIMPYWCFSPNAAGAFTIAPNNTYTSKYRYYVFDGAIDRQKNEMIDQDLKNPAQVSIIY